MEPLQVAVAGLVYNFSQNRRADAAALIRRQTHHLADLARGARQHAAARDFIVDRRDIDKARREVRLKVAEAP